MRQGRDIPMLSHEEEDGSIVEVALPWCWEICSYCEGHGTSSEHLGSFTSSEWDELDDDWKEDYLAGRFDISCAHCSGGRVRVVDEDRCDPKLLAEYQDQQSRDHEVDLMWEMERRMGA